MMNLNGREVLICFAVVAIRASALAYGPEGHQIVGGIADKRIANTPAAEKIYALTDGITLERASTIPDEIKSWDKKGADDPNAFPHYPNHPKVDNQLRDFWRANPPTKDVKSPTPSHHWFHYTDVPVLNIHHYSDGKTGRSEWDIVHMMGYCVDVLRGEVPEDNPRKITKPIAVILLVHYAADIHEPLHVGAEYFSPAGQPVDPDNGQPGLEDEGGNTLMLHLSHGTPEEMAKRSLKLHGFWDQDAVMANLPSLSQGASKEERYQKIEPAKKQIIERFAKEEPKNWRAPASVPLKNYGEFWADEILPIAKEAHERLQFINIHETTDHDRTIAAGDVREKNMSDHVGYADWAAAIVMQEFHRAGWRLADLLAQAVGSTSTDSTAPIASPEPIIAPPGKESPIEDSVNAKIAAAAATASAGKGQPGSDSDFGVYPENYKEIITTWLKKYSLDASRIDWQGEPRPAERANTSGQRFFGYLVVFNTPDPTGATKARNVLIRDGVVVVNSGFEK